MPFFAKMLPLWAVSATTRAVFFMAHTLNCMPARIASGSSAGQGGFIVKPVKHGLFALTAAAFLAFGSVACENTSRGVEDDATKAQEEARESASDAARTSGDATASMDAATETLDVKAALMASAVDASNINVDTMGDTRTVVLKGTVPTAAQKEEAGRIAAREAEGYRIDNQLVVSSQN
jgi:hypothetical protein